MSQQCPLPPDACPVTGLVPVDTATRKQNVSVKGRQWRSASGFWRWREWNRYECKRVVPLRYQRQLHTPNRRYTFTGDLRGLVDRMPILQQTIPKWTVTRHECRSLCTHGGYVVAARQVVDTRAQSSPEALCLTVITPLPHHLINAARAVHDLLHLHFGLQIIRRCIELAPQTVCRAIQIVHGILKVV